MEEKVLTVHLHEVSEADMDGLEVLERIAMEGSEVSLGFGKDNIDNWKGRGNGLFLDGVKGIVANHHLEIVQRGCNNRCTQRTHSHTDPYHENRCLYAGELPADQQEELMVMGRETIDSEFGVMPTAYCPPNGLYGKHTLRIAGELGYECFTRLGLIGEEPYFADSNDESDVVGTIVVTQTMLTRAPFDGFRYTNLDRLSQFEDGFTELIDRLGSVVPRLRNNGARFRGGVNSFGRIAYVGLRDLKKALRDGDY
jgi:hypothetical protein